MLSYVSYNVEFGKNIDTICTWIKQLPSSPDVLCFQEFPQSRIHQVMPTPGAYDYRYVGELRKQNDIYGQLTLYRTSAVRCVASLSMNLGETYLENLVMRTKNPKWALITVLEYENRRFVIANVHLSCLTLNARRRRQLEAIIKTIDSVSDAPLPSVIVGDYNYTSLIRQGRLMHLMARQSFHNAFKAKTHRLWFLRQQLDYIFFRGGTVGDIRIPALGLSDHEPVLFNYALTP